MFVKSLGAIMLILSGGLWGISQSEKLKNKVRFCDEAAAMFRKTAIMVRFNNYEVLEIVRILREECVDLIFLKNIDIESCMDFHCCWREAIEKTVPEGEERDLLIRFGCGLGTTDIEGQLQLIAASEAEIGELRKARYENYMKHGRVYRTVGMLFGLMTGIIFI